jgi:hypothetical protein
MEFSFLYIYIYIYIYERKAESSIKMVLQEVACESVEWIPVAQVTAHKLRLVDV